MLPLLFLFTLIKADPYHREYWLTPKTPSFSVLVLPRENVNWTLCLVYNSNTDGFDQAFPGQAPSYCSTGKERYYGFVVLKGLYLNNLLNVTVYRATIDVEVLLVNNLDSGGNALVFYFVRSLKQDYVMMDGNKNKVYIPELMIGNENQTVIVTTPDGSIKQISLSLPQVDQPERPKTTTIEPEEETTSSSSTLSTTISEQTTTTISSFLQQIIEESRQILPMTAKRSLETVTSSTTLVESTTTQLRAEPIKFTIGDMFKTSESPTTLVQTSTTTTLIPSTTTTIPPTTTLIPSTKTTSTLPTTTHPTSTLSSSPPSTTTTTQLISTTPHQNEEDRLWELLLKPKHGSKIQIIGSSDKNDEETPSELIMFEVGAHNQATPLPLPTFPSFIPKLDTSTAATSKSPCHGGGGFPPYAFPGGGGGYWGGGGQQPFMGPQDFGPPNPFVG